MEDGLVIGSVLLSESASKDIDQCQSGKLHYLANITCEESGFLVEMVFFVHRDK